MLKKFISYYKPHKKMFFLDLLAAFFISICDLFYPILTRTILYDFIPNKKLKSAFLTTFGGVKRDLGHFQAGIEMAEKAHVLLPKEFRPCTLLGALYFEIREYTTGSEWFEKAEELGAPKHNTDAEIKAIYHKADKEKKKELKNYLLSLDTKRYAWLNKSEKHNVKQAANKVT